MAQILFAHFNNIVYRSVSRYGYSVSCTVSCVAYRSVSFRPYVSHRTTPLLSR